MRGNDFSEKSVLLLDDSRAFLSLMTDILRGLGVRKIVRCVDAIEAFEVIGRESIHLAFVDYEMPIINGCEFASLVRTAPDCPDKFLPMILVTGHASRTIVMECLSAGFNHVLAKPLSAASLSTKMHDVFEEPARFILTPSGYFGPDRRRRNDPDGVARDRRMADLAVPVGPRDLKLIHWVQKRTELGDTAELSKMWAAVTQEHAADGAQRSAVLKQVQSA